MPKSTALRQDHRKRRTATALLESAQELFAASALHEVTVDEIAARAGVSVGSLYVHYGSKEALYFRVIEDAIRLGDQYTRGRRWSDSPLQRLLDTGEAYTDFALSHPAAFRLVSSGLPQQSDIPEIAEIQLRIAARSAEEAARIGGDLRAAVDAGEIAPIPVDYVLTYLWASWSGVIAMSQRDDQLRIPPDAARQILIGAATVLIRGASLQGSSTLDCAHPPRA